MGKSSCLCETECVYDSHCNARKVSKRVALMIDRFGLKRHLEIVEGWEDLSSGPLWPLI